MKICFLTLRLRSVLCFALLSSTSLSAAAEVSYKLTNLGTAVGGSNSAAFGINNAGDVVGSVVPLEAGVSYFSYVWNYWNAQQPVSFEHGFLYRGGTSTMLSPAAANSRAYAINESGQIAGSVTPPGNGITFRAVIWNGGVETNITGGMFGDTGSMTVAINNAGQAVGRLPNGGDPGGGFGFTYTNGTSALTALGGALIPFAIDSAGHTAGAIYPGSPYVSGGGADYTALATYGTNNNTQGSFVLGMNDTGTLVGYVNTFNLTWHATKWVDGVPVDLTPSTSYSSTALDVNNAGQIVGSFELDGAFIYENGTLTNLNDVVDFSGTGLTSLLQAHAINDGGAIVGVARDELGALRAFLLTPIRATPPPPATIVGAWFMGNASQANNSAWIVFMPNGTYTMGQDGVDDPTGHDGMESGTYTWDGTTLSTAVGTDTNGEWGLSTYTQPATVVENTLNLGAGQDLVHPSRVTSVSLPLVGSWVTADGLSTITFLDNGYFLGIEDGVGDSKGGPGIERGTYTFTNSQLTFTTLLDTNGEWGVGSGSTAASLSGDTLTIFGLAWSRVKAKANDGVDTFSSPANWALDSSQTAGGGVLSIANGRMEFTVATATADAKSQVIPSPGAGFASTAKRPVLIGYLNTNWSAQVDVHVKNFALNAGSPTTPRNAATAEGYHANLYVLGLQNTFFNRGLTAAAGYEPINETTSHGSIYGWGNTVPYKSTSTTGLTEFILRTDYNANTHVLTAYFSKDQGATWVIQSAFDVTKSVEAGGWGVPVNFTGPVFGITLAAQASNLAIASGDLYFDNFATSGLDEGVFPIYGSASFTNFAGTYFGGFSGDLGHWALVVSSNNTADFIAYLAQRKTAVVVRVTIDANGNFSVAGEEISPLANTVSALSARSGSKRATAVPANFTLAGQISSGVLTGELSGAEGSLFGTLDTTSGSAASGYYTAPAIGATGGTTYAIVAPSGRMLVVATTPTAVESASGTIGSDDRFIASTGTGAQLSLTLNASNHSIAGTLMPAGSNTPITFAGLADGTASTARLVNIATRAYCNTSDRVTIGGFVVSGTASKRVLVRAVGPTLTSQGISTAEVMLDPTMELHDAIHGNTIIATNDNWGDNANAAEITTVGNQIGANALLSTDTKSSALLLTLEPGVYSFVVSGKEATSGIVLLEVYDADPADSASNFVNIATRAYATTGNGVTIGGFVISGNAPKPVLLRAVGPTLTTQGIGVTEVLTDPLIELHDASHGNVVIATNDNWGDNPNAASITTTAARIGATPFAGSDTKSSALLVTLQPGVYSFVASGTSSTSGIVLVEIYDAE